MKKLFTAAVAALLFSGAAIADDVSVSASGNAQAAWVVIDGDVYYCAVPLEPLHVPFCVKAARRVE